MTSTPAKLELGLESLRIKDGNVRLVEEIAADDNGREQRKYDDDTNEDVGHFEAAVSLGKPCATGLKNGERNVPLLPQI